MSAIRVESVRFSSLHAPDPLTIPATLRLPEIAAALSPAVVIVHGSSGVDGRGAFHAEALGEARIATLEIDMWAARGLSGGLDRPKTLHETLPDLYGAFRYLAARADIDPNRIGVMGFSWGGVLAMLSATKAVSERFLGPGARFAAHAPFYPVCWLYNSAPGFEFKEFTGAPMLLQCGGADSYDEPDTGEKLGRSVAKIAPGLMTVETYAGATHAFDRAAPDIVVTDPFAHLGKGGEVLFAHDPAAAEKARAAAAGFFTKSLRA